MPETNKGSILKAPNPVLLPKMSPPPSPTNSIIETSSALLASVSSALLLRSNSMASVSSRRLSLAFPDLRALLLTPTSPVDPSMVLLSGGTTTSQFASLNLFDEPDDGFDDGSTVPILNSFFPSSLSSSSSAGTPDLRHSMTDSLTNNEGGGRTLKYLDDASSSAAAACLNDFLDDVTSMDEQEDLTDDESDGGNDRQIISMAAAAAEAVELHDLLISKRSLSSLGQCFMDGGMRFSVVEDMTDDRETLALFSDEDEFEQLYV
ncbi:hypothetical protein BJ741DRAFT_621170 [Chytriomyces cf. hyalinus JEL632]|nr:hypothetical protein BJ741DRAFT_621170 [Chytriomyces cf. hyalinus JEL632]